MLRSEQRSLYRFMSIYLFSTFFMFAIAAAVFYKFERFQIEENVRQTLKHDVERIMPRIKQGNNGEPIGIEGLKYAVYTGKKRYLFGNFTPTVTDWTSGFERKGNLLRHIRVIPPPHRMHTAYLVVEKEIDQLPIKALERMILYTALSMFTLFLVLGYFLGRLFIAPMREALEKINLFIQDTTHELNTPISTILTNIEMIELLGKCPKIEEMERIRIASGTLSRIYEDMSYLKLNEQYQRQIEPVDFSKLLQERLTYFSSLARAKQIALSIDITSRVILDIDRSDASRLIDNILSNAIKYNHVGGTISVALDDQAFVVQDSGRGMDTKTQKRVFERFERGDKSEGGFGIGLDIVLGIVKYYRYKIEMTSVLGEGTTIKIRLIGE